MLHSHYKIRHAVNVMLPQPARALLAAHGGHAHFRFDSDH
jgi:hypothetical protein